MQNCCARDSTAYKSQGAVTHRFRAQRAVIGENDLESVRSICVQGGREGCEHSLSLCISLRRDRNWENRGPVLLHVGPNLDARQNAASDGKEAEPATRSFIEYHGTAQRPPPLRQNAL